MKWLVVFFYIGLIGAASFAGEVKSDANISSDCLSCHRERDAAVVSDWEKSRHNLPDIDCRSCHGAKHDGTMAAHSRRNETCTGCHARENASYSTSKHGVIALLEAGQTDFSQPLSDGNYRSPTCAYCHMHAGNHHVDAAVLPLFPGPEQEEPLQTAKRSEARMLPCLDCHSPRFVKTWFTTGDRMVEIGRMKVREAMKTAAKRDDQEIRDILHRMTDDHLRNVRIGVGHQSPDEQWWHGHPALDGDLLRIKSFAKP